MWLFTFHNYVITFYYYYYISPEPYWIQNRSFRKITFRMSENFDISLLFNINIWPRLNKNMVSFKDLYLKY